jgi:hypothetical protein
METTLPETVLGAQGVDSSDNMNASPGTCFYCQGKTVHDHESRGTLNQSHDVL